eukprot:CAMPEP_0113587554 /NCGR_PEP_ID=MMETSP0015_2-20120614/34976_1 /TAXON_ID=2838 /ORGANISM="Odontella" /LENGTH=44 /DNA_ID=CAMNT_0000493233 /DNA_START=1 /DNA_END=135 /DNA_ORIENTATION=- /assembly_acc=CAM_ASM_000160
MPGEPHSPPRRAHYARSRSVVPPGHGLRGAGAGIVQLVGNIVLG